MSETRGTSNAKRFTMTPGSDLARMLTEAEAQSALVELVHGERSYWLVPYSAKGDDFELAWRRSLVDRTLAHRNEQQPLGITTAQLIREGRGESSGA